MRNMLRFLKGYEKESILAPLFKMLEACFELLVPLVVANIIDVGINRVDGKLVGDVAYEELVDKVDAMTPVPGGVGPGGVDQIAYQGDWKQPHCIKAELEDAVVRALPATRVKQAAR